MFQSFSSNYAWLQWNSTGIPPEWWKDFLVGLSDLWLPFLKFVILSAIFHSCSFASSNVASLFFILLTKPIWLLILEIWVYLSNSYLYLQLLKPFFFGIISIKVIFFMRYISFVVIFYAFQLLLLGYHRDFQMYWFF